MKIDTAKRNLRGDLGGVVGAAILILVGAVALWDTQHMVDADSYVFPRAIAVAMICFSLALIVWQMISPVLERNGEIAAVQGGSRLRRVALVATMLISSLLMPLIGFVLAGLLAFGALMGIAMYDPWTRGRVIVYPLVGVAIVIGFYFVFAELLLVPLPVGSLFE